MKAALSFLGLIACLSLVTTRAYALTPQQEKMKSCNTKAADMSGPARKEFLSTCLKSVPTPVPEKTLSPQQEKMKTCNADASTQNLKGDARKKFMSDCLKKK